MGIQDKLYPTADENAVKKNKEAVSTLSPDFRPFQAWRYSPKISPEDVIAPPYDVISPSEREKLYQNSPFNVIRLILGKEADFYENAARLWKEWSAKKILAQDPVPAIYLYSQTFQNPAGKGTLRRTALAGILKLEEPGAVLRHEATFEGPKKDRLLLLEKTKTNLSPVFGIYQNSKSLIESLYAARANEKPASSARDSQSVLHEIWPVRGREEISALRRVLEGQKILIADGHHRYETAVRYQKEQREREIQRKGTVPRGDSPHDFVMMALVGSDDPGLNVLPTHRIVRSFGDFSAEKMMEALKKNCELLAVPAKELFKRLNEQCAEEAALGVIFPGKKNFMVRFKRVNGLPEGKPPLWHQLDANLLNYFVFDRLWGLPEEKRRSFIEYTHSAEEAFLAVEKGGAAAAFLLKTPQVDTVRRLAYAGEKMPQKTTYFFPKLATGFFFYHHGI